MKFLVTLSIAFACLLAGPAHAHGGKHNDAANGVETRTVNESKEHTKARAYFTDTVLKTHDGYNVRFYTDVLEGKTVVISFIFTSCLEACPLINASLQRVQDRLGDRIGQDIVFVSITVDPETDTPSVLREYRKRFKAGRGWLWLTGDAASVEKVSERMGQVFERDAHLTALLVGNTRTARWRKIPAHLSDAVLAAQITDIADDNFK
ncbi:SCO family protein [Hyphomonas sp. BRH_c22]|uniref:SCO family protein n=1 Tax=Hyphomonas sp. BRH_c22 TaxID=1629710 RepID=UPI000B1C21E4|nr:SCO family protein [Hyphomonas sp. BRH_c22]